MATASGLSVAANKPLRNLSKGRKCGVLLSLILIHVFVDIVVAGAIGTAGPGATSDPGGHQMLQVVSGQWRSVVTRGIVVFFVFFVVT